MTQICAAEERTSGKVLCEISAESREWGERGVSLRRKTASDPHSLHHAVARPVKSKIGHR
jgi:hypothetical protein